MSLEKKNLSIFSKEGVKKLAKPFILLFLINFLIINWNNVSWLFSYRTIAGIAYKFVEILENKQSFAEGLNGKAELVKENSLEIPKIGITVPLIVAEDSSQKYFDKELDRGVALFPNSVLPGETGQTIILGHSAPPNWPKINYDGVFSQISDLEKGDEITLYFNNKKYTYSVNGKIFLEKGEEIPNNEISSDNRLLLISCWPPGKNIQRIVVESSQNKN
jgi:LPXTG-site transpeptidase (sortase) family protein